MPAARGADVELVVKSFAALQYTVVIVDELLDVRRFERPRSLGAGHFDARTRGQQLAPVPDRAVEPDFGIFLACRCDVWRRREGNSEASGRGLPRFEGRAPLRQRRRVRAGAFEPDAGRAGRPARVAGFNPKIPSCRTTADGPAPKPERYRPP